MGLMGCASQEHEHVCPDANLLPQAVERAEEYHRTICQLSAELAQLQEEKLALCEEVVALKEECCAAAIQADNQASTLRTIQPLLGGALNAQEGPVSCLLTHPSHDMLVKPHMPGYLCFYARLSFRAMEEWHGDAHA